MNSDIPNEYSFPFSYKQRMKKMYEDEDDAELMSTSYHMNATDTSLEVSQLNSSNPVNMSIEWMGRAKDKCSSYYNFAFYPIVR